MKFWFLLLGLGIGAATAHAALPDFQAYPASGERLLLWTGAERGLAEPELAAMRKLAGQGVGVWALDPAGAYFLPQLPSSLDAVPTRDMVDWLGAALASGKQVTVYAVGRAAVPVLRATAQLDAAQRSRLCVMLMYPNLYASAEALADADYLETGRLDGLRIRVLQPRRSAATPWLPGLLDHLTLQGATVSHTMLENLREAFWARETPTDYETAESGRLDTMLLHEMNAEGCK